jgi:23S rRNA pseudouridine2605 synthase
MEERLNKVLAHAGVASRRGVEALIAQQRITVNGEVVTDMGRRVSPGDDIRVDGDRVKLAHADTLYYALYKPRHVLSTASDPFDRPTVMDFIGAKTRLYPVGRLDGASEGLILLTNDGDMTQQLTHPSFEHEKEYRIKISGTPTDTALKAWREGTYLDDGRTQPATVKVESTTGSGTWLRVILREGRNRQLRRMIENFNHLVHRLIRVRMGPILLGNLSIGEWRPLIAEEIAALHAGTNEAVYHRDAPAPKAPKTRPSRPIYKAGWAKPKPKPRRGRK